MSDDTGKPKQKPKRSTHQLQASSIRHRTRTPEGLTVPQEAYARARAMGMSVNEAATAVGVSPNTAKNWERDEPWVSDRITQLSGIATQNAIIKTGLNREWVITRLMSVVDRCMQAEPVTDKSGEATGQFKFDASGANQALKMLGDTMGMFRPVEKKEDDYANLSDADLARIAHELASQTGLLANLAGDQTEAGSEQVIDVQALPKAN